MPIRRSTFKLYPNAAQRAALQHALTAHCKVYNTLLETARLRYKAGLPAYSRKTVCEATKSIRDTVSAIAGHTLAQSLQATGERLVASFDRFFERVARGETPGYPRFKSVKRYSGFGFKQHTQGYRLLRKKHIKNGQRVGWAWGSVKLTNIGTVSMKGCARFDGEPTSATIYRRGDIWFLSVAFKVDDASVTRTCEGEAPFAFDVGLTDLLTTLGYRDGEALYGAVENPRWMKRRLTDLVKLQRGISALEQQAIEASGKKKGFPIERPLSAAYQRLRALHKRIRAQREDFYHKLSARLVARYGHIITEELSVASMQADDTKKAPLKRSVADAAWGGFLNMLRYKAEEAGSKLEEVPTRQVKPTRRCSCCGAVKTREEMPLSQRLYTCLACGYALERDRNACRNMMRYAFEGAWWDSGSTRRPGTGLKAPIGPALVLTPEG